MQTHHEPLQGGPQNVLLEICTFNATDVVRAVNAGADRIELCASYVEGGITPSAGAIAAAFTCIAPERVVVMIRPRGGNFLYDTHEFEMMQQDIHFCKSMGVKNFIFGVLTPDGRLDIDRNTQLVELAHPHHCTLQRAFDLTRDPFEALEDAMTCGFRRILTSGQAVSAWEGRACIRELIIRAEDRIDILPGAGVNSKNAAELIAFTGCKEIHTSAKQKFTEPVTAFQFRSGIYDSTHLTEVHAEEVSALKKITSAISR